MKGRKGFTLIELLAVIIILGILMLIAIPSVTTYINNSRKNTYVDTIQEIIKGTVAKVNSGDLDMFDTDTTYYIPTSAIKLENGNVKSPYGDLDDAYVVVTYDGDGYDYYFVGKDETGMGIDGITKKDNITVDSIKKVDGNVDTSVALTGTTKVVVFDDNLGAGPSQPADSTTSGVGQNNTQFGDNENNNNNNNTRLQRPYTGIAYAANVVDFDNNSGKAYLNELLSEDIEIFATSEEARLKLQENQYNGVYLPYCLKYRLDQDVVKEVYIEFEITESYANSHPGSNVGVYTLRGDVNEYDLESRPVYESNRQQLLTAFGTSANCSAVTKFDDMPSGTPTVGTRCINSGSNNWGGYADAHGKAYFRQEIGNECRVNGVDSFTACY